MEISYEAELIYDKKNHSGEVRIFACVQGIKISGRPQGPNDQSL